MTPEDRDLARLLDRDLARIRLPERAQWRGAGRARRSWVGPLFAVPLAAAVIVLAVAAGLGLEQYRQGSDRLPAATTPSPSATVPAPSPSPTAPPRRAVPIDPVRYVHLELGYGFDLPRGWRHSPCAAGVAWIDGQREVHDMLLFGDPPRNIGSFADHVRLRAVRNDRGLTPRQWEQERRHLQIPPQTPPETLEDTTLAGRPALRADFGALRGEFGARARVTYLVAANGWMYEITHEERTGATSAAEREAVVRSFRIVPADELARRRAEDRPAPGASSPEALVDALADAFALRSIPRLVGLMTPCMSTGFEQAHATGSERDLYARSLADRFAAGLRIEVRPRPIEGDRTRPDTTLHVWSTWSEPGQPDREIRLMLSPTGERWYWRGTVQRMTAP